MRIGIIGCGRVGITLGYLVRNHNRIIGVYDIDPRNEARAYKIFGLKKNPDYARLIRTSDVLFFATPDDEILKAYRQAAKFISPLNKYLFHFSGLLPAEIFPAKSGISRASVHPFATFPRLVMPPFRKKYFLFAQGDEKALNAARRIFTKKYFIIKYINRGAKGYYHLLGVFASNLLVGLYEATRQLARKLKWNKKEIDDLVFSIIEDTITNIRKYDAKDALSGPIKRADTKTVRRHLRLLKKTPNLFKIYSILSQSLLKYAPEKKKETIKKMLSSNSN